jgi:hypothetical protein
MFYAAIPGITPEYVRTLHRGLIEKLQQETFGTDPASSDLAASEVEEAVKTILDSTEATFLGLYKRQQQRPPGG